jgi:hypothetical protein
LLSSLGSPQHDEEDIVIEIQFGALMRLIGVLDHQLVETELRLDRAEQRLVRVVQTEPNDPAVAACKGPNLLDGNFLNAAAITVAGAGDNRAALRHISDFGAC